MESSNRHLMWHGMFLFLLGLLTGLANTSPTCLGLAAPGGCHKRHLPCCIGRDLGRGRDCHHGKGDGILDCAVRYLRELAEQTLAAVFGTAANTPIAAAGYSGQPWQEDFLSPPDIPNHRPFDFRCLGTCSLGLRARASQSWRGANETQYVARKDA